MEKIIRHYPPYLHSSDTIPDESKRVGCDSPTPLMEFGGGGGGDEVSAMMRDSLAPQENHFRRHSSSPAFR